MPDKYREIVGAIHIHSDCSDGTKPIEEIAEIAAEVGLDFIMVSDHMTLKPLHEGLEGLYHDTAVIIGYEINDIDDRNHYLAFGLKEVLPETLTPIEYVRQVKEKGGLGIIAHPDEIRELSRYPSYPWTDWQVEGYDGIEIWNHMSQWMESLSRWNMLKQAFMPRRALKSPTARILKRWDQVNLERKVVGVGSIDVHAYPYRLGPIRVTVFPYKVQFKAIRTHILIPESVPNSFSELKAAIFASLKQCRAFISNYRWGDASGFDFYAENVFGKAIIGDKLTFADPTKLVIKSPQSAELNIIRNGKTVYRDIGADFIYNAGKPGLYRVEIARAEKGWIYSNHIRLG